MPAGRIRLTEHLLALLVREGSRQLQQLELGGIAGTASLAGVCDRQRADKLKSKLIAGRRTVQ